MITEYNLIVTRLSENESIFLISDDSILEVLFLVPYSRYEVVIAANTMEGSGPYSESLVLQTDEDGKW